MEARKKQSIAFTQGNLKLLNDNKRMSRETAQGLYFDSTNAQINYLVKLFFGLSDDASRFLSEQCARKVLELRSIREKEGVGEEFFKDGMHAFEEELLSLLEFFSKGASCFFGPETFVGDGGQKNMRRIDISGGYVLFPDDWIVIDRVPPEKAKTAVCIEFYQAAKYGLPHFLFLRAERGVPLNKYDRNDILKSCAKVSEELKAAMRQYTEQYYDNLGNELLEWGVSPHPAFIQLGELGCERDVLLEDKLSRDGMPSSQRAFPYGAMVVRDDRFEADDLTGWHFLPKK